MDRLAPTHPSDDISPVIGDQIRLPLCATRGCYVHDRWHRLNGICDRSRRSAAFHRKSNPASIESASHMCRFFIAAALLFIGVCPSAADNHLLAQGRLWSRRIADGATLSPRPTRAPFRRRQRSAIFRRDIQSKRWQRLGRGHLNRPSGHARIRRRTRTNQRNHCLHRKS